MSGTKPGADELRIRGILRQRGVGPDAPAPQPVPPKPAVRPRDWLDDILDDNTPPAAPKPEPVPKRSKAKKKPKKRRRAQPTTPRAAVDTRPTDPRQSLTDAWDRVPHRLKWLASHATAAAAGWQLGIVDWGTHTAAWYAAGHWTSPSAWVLYGIGGCCIALYRRARNWAWPVAWAASIPVSSVVVGVLLYGTTP